LTRRYYQCRCCGQEQGYAADSLLQCDERMTRLLRSHVCRFSSDVSFAHVAEHLQATLGVSISAETCRTSCEREASGMVKYEQTTPAAEFLAASGEVEFQTDAVKVNTCEEGWKDLKIACFLKREQGESATPAEWESRTLPAPRRKKARQLGIRQGGQVHALGDGASWIWKGLGRMLSGCTQTLDIFHAAEKFARAGDRLYGEGTEEAKAFHEQGRALLLEKGWDGVTELMAEELQKGDTPERRKVLDKMLNYFVPHAGRLNYAQMLNEGQSIGSGAIEGFAKTLGLRLKLRGSRWKRQHVKPMATLIHLRHSSRWHQHWKTRAA
jgi:hypothetical protein